MTLIYLSKFDITLSSRVAYHSNLIFGEIFKDDDLLKQFNEDIELLNKIILSPPTELNLSEEAYQKQEKYNLSLEEGSKRWNESDRSIQVGNNAVHELALCKKEFEKTNSKLEEYLKKKKIIINFSLNDEPWEKIFRLFQNCDEEIKTSSLKKLNKLRKNWQAQNYLANFNSYDLI